MAPVLPLPGRRVTRLLYGELAGAGDAGLGVIRKLAGAGDAGLGVKRPRGLTANGPLPLCRRPTTRPYGLFESCESEVESYGLYPAGDAIRPRGLTASGPPDKR